MSFNKYPKNYHANGYGWHNMAAMGYAKPPSPSKNSSFSSGVSSLYPSTYGMPLPNAFGGNGPTMSMPPLPNSQYNNAGNVNIGAQLSYGFAPNILPNQIPNVQRNDSVEKYGGGGIGVGAGGSTFGWNIGGISDNGSNRSSSVDSGVHDPIQAQQEKPCQSIFVPDEDMPIYSFGFPSVSNFRFSFFFFV